MHEIISSANANAYYRYIVLDETTSEPALLLWVLNWKCEIGTLSENNLQLSPAIKLLYLPFTSSSTDAVSIYLKWSHDRQVETIQYPTDCLIELLSCLNKNNASLPMDKQYLNQFMVSLMNIL